MQRPTPVTVLAILNIIFGALGLLCGPFALFSNFMPAQPGANPVMDVMKAQTVYTTLTTVATVIGILASGVMLASGIGMLKLAPWARTAAIGVAAYSIVSGLLSILLFAVMIVPKLMQFTNSPDAATSAGATGGMVGGLTGGFCGMIYPIVLLIFLTRPQIKSAFEAPTIPPGGPGDPQQPYQYR